MNAAIKLGTLLLEIVVKMNLAHTATGKALTSLAHVITSVPGTNTGNMSVHMASNICLHSNLLRDEVVQALATYVDGYGTLGADLDQYDLVSTGTKLYTLINCGEADRTRLKDIKRGDLLEIDLASKYMVVS